MTYEGDSHRAVRGVSAAEVRARPRAKVGVIPFRLVDPPPAQILPEVDVQPPNAAVLLVVSESRKKSRQFPHLPVHILALLGSWRGLCVRSEAFPCTFHLDVSETSISVLYGLINMSDSLLRLRNSTVRCVIFSLLDPTQVWSANREPHTKEPVHYIAYWDKSKLASSCRTSQMLRAVRCQLKNSFLWGKSLQTHEVCCCLLQ